MIKTSIDTDYRGQTTIRTRSELNNFLSSYFAIVAF